MKSNENYQIKQKLGKKTKSVDRLRKGAKNDDDNNNNKCERINLFLIIKLHRFAFMQFIIIITVVVFIKKGFIYDAES